MECKICGSEIVVREDKKGSNIYGFCGKCMFVEKLNKVGMEIEKEEYIRHNNNFENNGYVKYLNDFLDEGVSPFVESGLHLDYGCGPGPVLHGLMEQRGFFSKTYDYYHQHDEDYSKYKYDIITSTEVFEHFYDPIRNIEKILKLLNNGGILSIMTSFVKPLPEFYEWWYIRDITHVSFYHAKTFEFIAEKYGLEIIYSNNKNIIVLKVNFHDKNHIM